MYYVELSNEIDHTHLHTNLAACLPNVIFTSGLAYQNYFEISSSCFYACVFLVERRQEGEEELWVEMMHSGLGCCEQHLEA